MDPNDAPHKQQQYFSQIQYHTTVFGFKIYEHTLDLENIDFGWESRALAPNLRLLAAKSSQKNKKRNRIKLDVKIVLQSESLAIT